ncbi:KH domain-containing protein [Patescibacteria group bacterium]|nr:KH domain-containing protein [Patescibacteria group bacterium]
MDIEDTIKTTLEELLKQLDINFSKIDIDEDEEKDTYNVNIVSEDQSLLIGQRGGNIQALQHLLKILTWHNLGTERQFHIVLDVDNYRQKQEENVISLAERKIAILRKTRRPQSLPPMSPYFRRKIHLHLMGAGFEDIETESREQGERRHIVIKLK